MNKPSYWWPISLLGAIIVTIVLIALAANLQTQEYEHTTIEHCQQFKVIPEEHIDRVPDGCVAEYYKDR